MKPLQKIAILGKYYPPFHGGMETVTESLAQHHSTRAEVDVFVANHLGNNKAIDVSGHLKVHRLPILGTFASTPICPSALRVSFASYDIINIQSPNPFFELALLLNSKTPFVVTHQSDIVKQKILKHIYSPMYSKVLEKSSNIIATSAEYANSSEVLRPFLNKVRVIPNGVFENICNLTICKTKPISIPNDISEHGYVLGVGRLVPYKGFEYLIKSAEFHSLPIIIVGKGPLHQKLRKLIDVKQLQNRVFILNNIDNDELSRLFHHCTMFVLSSITKNEAFGVVQLEAMSHSKPVISCRVPGSGITSINMHNETGLVVNPCQPHELGQAILKLAASPELSLQLGKNAKNRVETRFSASVVAQQTWELYEEVVNRT